MKVKQSSFVCEKNNNMNMSGNQNIHEGYQAYIDYYRTAFEIGAPVPTFTEWLFQNQMYSQAVSSNSQYMQNSASSSSIASSDNDSNKTTTGKRKRERWTEKETRMLVNMWKENFNDLETAKHNSVWAKIKDRVNDVGFDKTMKQTAQLKRRLQSST